MEVLQTLVAVLLLMLIIVMSLVLLAIWKVKRVLSRALTFVFTFSLKPRWKKL